MNYPTDGLPPEPGSTPDPNHGIPGDPEPEPEKDTDRDYIEDLAIDYSDDDGPDEFSNKEGLPEEFDLDDGLDDPDEEG